MSILKIEDVAHVRFRAPDLGQMRAFLEDFGLMVVDQTETRLVGRGSGPAPIAHVTDLGEPGFVGVAFRAEGVQDLERLAAAEGVSVADSDLPGGGQVLTIQDPDGHRVDVVAGQAAAPLLPLAASAPWNRAEARERLRAAKRIAPGAANVVRLGHVVLNVSDFRASERWYKDRFGFITSDEIQVAPEIAIGAFLRCDRGDTPTDHHTLFLMQGPKGPGFNHAAYEVADLDDLMRGHQRLKDAGREAEWGVGRHLLGSQVFDYWRDPWGHTLEHWTDGDLFTAADGSSISNLQELLGVQWGPQMPATMA
ncbi:VOC family protein [Phenylobacterium sp.]|uniref:VOC family protein n=1 Tax=Phenylobacterium sp. TaxID=1871053 RepID=UPI002FC66D35